MSKPCNNSNPLPPGIKPVFRTSGTPVYDPNTCLPPSPPVVSPPVVSPPPLEPCKGSLKRINGVCGCPPDQIVWQGIMCVPKCTDGKINLPPMGACGCPSNFEQVDGKGPCVPKCSYTEERINGKCVPKCTNGMERVNEFCKCPGNLIQKNGVGPCVPPEPVPPEPVPPEPVPSEPVSPKVINKIIASLLRSLSFTGTQIGEMLKKILGPQLADIVKKNKYFNNVFTKTNKAFWVNAINKAYIEEKFKAVESGKLDAESDLANYILKMYTSLKKLVNGEKNFIKLIFDLIYTVKSIYNEDLLNVYSSYFKVFIKKDILKLLSKDCKKGADPYDCIFEKLQEHGISVKSKGGRRKTIKRRKPTNKKTKKHRHN